MRHTRVLALTAAAFAIGHPAQAQDRIAPRVAIAGSADPFTMLFNSDDDRGSRAALGVNTSATGTLRDTLGLLITAITRGSPAEKAGLEEGNRLAAINGVSLRANAADVEDFHSTGTLSRRLVRELSKAKPGDEVELRVYRDGRTHAMKVRTADSDSLFRRTSVFRRTSRADMDERPALGIGLGNSGNRRDTLGVLVISVQDSSPAARAGLEEGNRIATINGVNLRVSREDAGDHNLGHAKTQRLSREVSQLKPGDNVTLRVYGSGQWRDVTLKVARAGDLPRSRNMMFFGSDVSMPAMPAMPPRPPMPPTGMRTETGDDGDFQFEIGPVLTGKLEGLRMELDRLRPELNRIRMEVPRLLESIRIPDVKVRVDARHAGMSI